MEDLKKQTASQPFSAFSPEKYIKNLTGDNNTQFQEFIQAEKATDAIIAKAWLMYVNYEFVYNHSNRKWYFWNSRYWQEDSTKIRIVRLLDFSLSLKEFALCTDDRALQNKLLDSAIKLENTKSWDGVFEAATVLNGKSSEHFNNAQNNLISLNNGIYDLTTQQIKPFNKTDYLTTTLSYDFDQEAVCPIWLNFINDTFAGNQSLIEFIQKAVGYTLTSEVSEQKLFFLYGNGSNGKSVFSEILISLLGSYAIKLPLVSLIYNKNNSDISQRETIRLKGKRLAISNEIEEGVRLSESLIKDLTGGDTVTGKALYQPTLEFKPTHKLWVYGNHKPAIRGTDNGIWRRIVLIPFSVTVRDEKKDPDLVKKLTNELPGILNWALIGMQKWKANGLNPLPEAIIEATADYKSEMDIVGNFLKDCCEENAVDVKCSQKELYSRFQQWQKETDETGQMTSKMLTMKLNEKGIKSYRGSKNLLFWLNLKLLEIRG